MKWLYTESRRHGRRVRETVRAVAEPEQAGGKLSEKPRASTSIHHAEEPPRAIEDSEATPQGRRSHWDLRSSVRPGGAGGE